MLVSDQSLAYKVEKVDVNDCAGNNQFLLSIYKLSDHENWQETQIGDYFLYTDPGLEISIKNDIDCKFILLGYWYDYRHPLRSNQEITNALNINGKMNDLLSELQYLSGIFLVIWRKGDQLFLIPDLCALRECYLYQSTDSKAIAGSSPSVIGMVCTICEIRNDFYKSDQFKKRGIWIGDTTYYKNVTRLKPNHYFEVYSRKSARFFPLEKIHERDINDVVQDASKILCGILEAIHSREQKVVVGLTAGWDSRLVLAASRKISGDLIYFVNRYDSIPSYDHKIPMRLAKRFNLTFLILHLSSRKRQGALQDERLKLPNPSEQNLLKLLEFRKVFKNFKSISGGISEIARNEFGLLNDIDGTILASLAKYHDDGFCIKIYNEWLQANAQYFETHNFETLDMFYWEEILANRVGKASSEAHSLNISIFPVFHCRHLITTLLSCPTEFRDKQNNVLYKRIISNLWEETLEFPINPGLKKRIIRFMQKLGVYNFYRSVFTNGILPSK